MMRDFLKAAQFRLKVKCCFSGQLVSTNRIEKWLNTSTIGQTDRRSRPKLTPLVESMFLLHSKINTEMF